MRDYLNLNVITNFVPQLHPPRESAPGLVGLAARPCCGKFHWKACDALGAMQTRTGKAKNLPFVPLGGDCCLGKAS